MARRASSGKSKPSAPVAGLVGRVVSLFRRFPIGSTLGALGGLVVTVGAAVQIYDRFIKPVAVSVGYVETAFAALSEGAMMEVDADRLFSGGFKARVQLSLGTATPHAAINWIAVRPVTDVPEPVLQRAKAGLGTLRQEPAWAGARQVDTYYAVLEGSELTVVYYGAEGQTGECNPDNLLDCEGRQEVIELNAGGDITHNLDVQLLYRDVEVRGVGVEAGYTIGGVDRVAQAQTLYVFN